MWQILYSMNQTICKRITRKIGTKPVDSFISSITQLELSISGQVPLLSLTFIPPKQIQIRLQKYSISQQIKIKKQQFMCVRII